MANQGQHTTDQVTRAADEILAALRVFAGLPADTPPAGILPSAWRAALDAARAAIAKAEGR